MKSKITIELDDVHIGRKSKIQFYIIAQILDKIDKFYASDFSGEEGIRDFIFFVKRLKDKDDNNEESTAFCIDFNEDEEHTCWMCFGEVFEFYIAIDGDELYDDIYTDESANEINEINEIGKKLNLSINQESYYTHEIENALLKILEACSAISHAIGLRYIYEAVNYKKYLTGYKKEPAQ